MGIFSVPRTFLLFFLSKIFLLKKEKEKIFFSGKRKIKKRKKIIFCSGKKRKKKLKIAYICNENKTMCYLWTKSFSLLREQI